MNNPVRPYRRPPAPPSVPVASPVVGQPPPQAAPTEAAKQQYNQWLVGQILATMQTTRALKTNLAMQIMSDELATETRKWLYGELMQMAALVEVKEG